EDRDQRFQEKDSRNAPNRDRSLEDPPGLHHEAPRVIKEHETGGDQQKKAAEEVDQSSGPTPGLPIEDVNPYVAVLQERVARTGHEDDRMDVDDRFLRCH